MARSPSGMARREHTLRFSRPRISLNAPLSPILAISINRHDLTHGTPLRFLGRDTPPSPWATRRARWQFALRVAFTLPAHSPLGHCYRGCPVKFAQAVSAEELHRRRESPQALCRKRLRKDGVSRTVSGTVLASHFYCWNQ